MLAQRTSEFCRFCCCQPNIDWRVHDLPDPDSFTGYSESLPLKLAIKEDAPYVGRCCSFCSPGCRETKYSVTQHDFFDNLDDPQGSLVMTHEKGVTCGVNVLVAMGDGGQLRIPMCCDLPKLETKDPQGKLLGVSRYDCDAFLCVPKYSIEDANGTKQYKIRPNTCCGGCCVMPKCDGERSRCFRIPYFFYDYNTGEKLGDSRVEDLWAGLKNECCTRRNMYSLVFPPNCTEEMKATILGLALLIDITVYEQDQQ
jgi:hypothetical protein